MADRCWSEEDWRAFFRTLEWPKGEMPWWMTEEQS